MEAADAKYAAAVAESLWIRKRDLEAAWNKHAAARTAALRDDG